MNDDENHDPGTATMTPAADTPEPRILPRPEHPASRKLIDRNATKVASETSVG